MGGTRWVRGLSLGVVPFFLACAASSPAPEDPAAAPTASARVRPVPESPKLSKVRAEFSSTCQQQRSDMGEFCACRWNVLSQMVPHAELETGGITSISKAKLERELVGQCGRHFPEALVKDGWQKDCESAAGMGAFCACRYRKLTEGRPYHWLADPAHIESASFLAARKASTLACLDELPVAVVRGAVVDECNRRLRTRASPLCECQWTELRQRYTVSEIAGMQADSPETQKLQDTVRAACSKANATSSPPAPSPNPSR